ncbi:MAG: TonB-dependent receptor [Pseudomonadota bacterium]
MATQAAYSQSAAPNTVVLDEIVVETDATDTEDDTSLDSPSADGVSSERDPVEKARATLDALAGGTAIITESDTEGKANVTIADTFAGVPGVVVQSFFGGNDQPRIQIRGSGLQQNPVERGILVLQDGLPINRADGSYIVGFADPGSAHFTEIFRGYTANRLGATVLGGAVNFASHNGATSPGGEFGVEGGSFGQFTTQARAGARAGDLDGHASVSFSTRDGFRDYNASERFNVNFNSGYRINENISTRLFVGYTDLGFDVAGPLSKTLLQSDPTQVCSGPPTCLGPNVIRDQPRRDAEQLRIGSRTSARFGEHSLDFGLGYAYTDDRFRFPIPGGVRDTEGGDVTVVARYAYAPDVEQELPLFELTGQYVVGSADRDYLINSAGQAGATFGESELDAATLSIHAGFHIPVPGIPGLVASPALAYSHATRENTDLFASPTRPTLAFGPGGPVAGAVPAVSTSYDRSFDGWVPSFGLTYEISPVQRLFAAVSRSFEPPTHDDLISTIGGNPNRSPRAFSIPDLEEQTATTIEGGWKGSHGRFDWSAVAYYSWIDNELLNLRGASGVPLGAVNADDTVHFGVELGVAAQITDSISARLAYTYQDFRFDDDPRFGDNRLAGAPRHNVNAALRYSFMPGVFVEAEVDWRPDETPVDNANTLFNDGFVVVDVRGNYRVDDNFSLFAEARNVFDEVYASSTLIADTAANQNQAAFLPGDGRAFVVGLKARF